MEEEPKKRKPTKKQLDALAEGRKKRLEKLKADKSLIKINSGVHTVSFD